MSVIIIHCSATVPPDIVGVWTVEDRRGQEPGRRPAQHQETVTDQVSDAVTDCFSIKKMTHVLTIC